MTEVEPSREGSYAAWLYDDLYQLVVRPLRRGEQPLPHEQRYAYRECR
jgi:hypothetical protein